MAKPPRSFASLFAAYDKDNPNSRLIQKISEHLGVEKLIPNVLPDNVEVR